MVLAQIIGWSVALLPVLLLLGMFLWLDVFKLISPRETLALLLTGAATAGAAYPLSGAFLDTLPIGFSAYSRFVAPWVEEGLKCVAVIILFRLNRIGFKIDAVIMGFAVGAGFALVENIIYLLRFPDVAPAAWMVRGLGTAVMHGSTVALLAAIAHELAERETRQAANDYDFRLRWFVPGFALAVIMHTLFNQFPDRPAFAMLATLVLAPIALILILRFGTAEAQQWLKQEMRTHSVELAALRNGEFPPGEASRRIAAFAARARPPARARILEYWSVLTSLVVAAERRLLQEAEDAEPAAIDAAADLQRLHQLKKELGPTVIAGLTPLLPFSRNDYWELSQLREWIDARPGVAE